MPTDSLGKVLPQLLFPFVRQWAQRSGVVVVSKILEDEQFLALVEKYADDIMASLSPPVMAPRGNGKTNGHSNGHTNGQTPGAAATTATYAGAEPEAPDLATLNARVVAMEQQLESQQALFEILRSKIRPMALALGCCPECVVGVFGCSKCMGQSKVGYFQPDPALLQSQILDPLAARGVPITLNNPQSKNNFETKKKRSTPWPKK